MARRRRTGAAEDIIDLTALLPWWAGVALALALYVVLHRLSAPVPTAGVQPGQISGFMARTMVATLAGIGQYLLPLLCLIGAAADGEKFLVPCKHWKAYKVGVSVVRELYGLMIAKGALGGFVITSGRFTREAKDFAAGSNIRQVDVEALFAALIQSVHAMGARSAADTPVCPLCGEAMMKCTIQRITTRGRCFGGARGPGMRQVGRWGER